MRIVSHIQVRLLLVANKMYTITQPAEWAPADPILGPFEGEVWQSPPNTPTKSIKLPVYKSRWIGIGSYIGPVSKKRRIQYHPAPVTPEKIREELIIRK